MTNMHRLQIFSTRIEQCPHYKRATITVVVNAMLCQADSAVMHTGIVALSLIVISHTHTIPLLLTHTRG